MRRSLRSGRGRPRMAMRRLSILLAVNSVVAVLDSAWCAVHLTNKDLISSKPLGAWGDVPMRSTNQQQQRRSYRKP